MTSLLLLLVLSQEELQIGSALDSDGELQIGSALGDSFDPQATGQQLQFQNGADDLGALHELDTLQILASEPNPTLLDTIRMISGSRTSNVLEGINLAPETGAALETAEPSGNEPPSVDVGRAGASARIPSGVQPMIAQFIQFFQGPGRKSFLHYMARAGRFAPMMQSILVSHGLPRDTVYLAMIESGFSMEARSSANAVGPWQFLADTARSYGLRQDAWVDERRDPIKSTHAAAKHLLSLHKEMGDWYLAWAAYNAGSGRMRQIMQMKGSRDYWAMSQGEGMPQETKRYVPKLIACTLLAKNPSAFGFRAAELESAPLFTFDEVPLTASFGLDELARAAQCSVADLRELNPELNRSCTPPASPGLPYSFRVPRGHSAAFADNIAGRAPQGRGACSGVPVPSAKASSVNASSSARPSIALQAAAPEGGHSYKVKVGDTLWSLSQKFHCTSDDIRRWNGMPKTGGVQPGTVLTIRAGE